MRFKSVSNVKIKDKIRWHYQFDKSDGIDFKSRKF